MYDGSTWSVSNSTNQVGSFIANAGTQYATLKAGGSNPAITNMTEEWNGTSWTVSCNMITTQTNVAS